jgi:tetratricopeptide (TPR) repeat protein
MVRPYHPVSTHIQEAQEAFDKGLTAIYAFNYDVAVTSFDKARLLDPHLAMAYWGLALALDETLDEVATENHAKLTYMVCQQAVELSKNATPKEQAYIKALATRFSLDPNEDRIYLRECYSKAMKEVVHTFPDDLDATTLYAESLMDNLLWDLYKSNGSPLSATPEIVNLLESVIKRDPYHVGANHYYIHAVENSLQPERGLMSAYRLLHMDLTEWGHLLHSPSHIYLRLGFYEEAVEANKKAIAADKKYIQTHGLEGRYPLKYLIHNLAYLTIAYMWQERYEEALSTAQELDEIVRPFASRITILEDNFLMLFDVYLYFHRWEEMLRLPVPKAEDEMVGIYWLFARAMAFAALGQLEQADYTQALFEEQMHDFLKSSKGDSFYTQQLFSFAEKSLKASITRAKGDLQASIEHLKRAAEEQSDFLDFTWFYPICQTLGSTLIEADRLSEAEEVFRHALAELPRNGRSLFGLSQALKLQKKDDYFITRESKDALKHAPKELSLKDL